MNPRRFAVVGDPVAHSKSPIMHSAAFAALGLPHTYEAIRAKADALPRIVMQLRAGEFDGLNITVPHKQRIMALADVLDPSARSAGASNTLVRRADCTISAHNTDAPALAAELGRLAGDRFSWGTGRALVLGSGGAARAAVAALGLHLGVRDVAVRARAFADPARLAAFVEAAPCPVAAQPWAADPSSERLTVALVQATTAGMSGGGDGDLAAGAVAWTALPPEAIALEVIYAPRETPWLRAARARGLRSDDGLGMLARQGALALELWLGIDAPLTAMRSALE